MGSRVDRWHTVKYLGVWIDENLTWKDHIKYAGRKWSGGLASYGNYELHYLREY